MVEGAELRREDMDHSIDIVHGDPLTAPLVDADGTLTGLLLHHLADRLLESADACGAVALSDDHIVGGSIMQAVQVEDGDGVSFLGPEALYDTVYKRFRALVCCGRSCQKSGCIEIKWCDLLTDEEDDVLDMVRLRKHIHRLRHGDGVLLLKSLQISCLTGGITAHVDDAVGVSM